MEQKSSPDLRLIGQEDRIFAGRHYPKPFCFNQDVAMVFDDMANRSIPLYRDVTLATAEWARHFYQSGTLLIDIGCSTGTSIQLIAQSLREPARFLAIDSSAAMIARAQEKLHDMPAQHHLDLVCADVMHCSLSAASVVIINYTLQFLPVADRSRLLCRIYEALVPGGVLILSEKVRSPSAVFQELTTGVYERFKEKQGYSHTEIARKKEALDHVLIPYTEDEHRQNLQRAGFSSVDSFLKWNNFLTLIALKA